MANVRSEFRIGLKDETARGVASVSRSLDSLKSKALAIGTGITAAGGIFGALIKQSADLADELGKTAQRAGVTVEALSGLQYAAKLSDVDLGSLSGGLQRLSRTMADAARGSSTAVDAFRTLGVDFADSTGRLRQTDVVFTEIAEKFSKLPDGATKTALAMQLLGRSGAEMIPLLNAGASGLEAYRKEAEQLGLIIDTKTAKAAEEFNDNLTRINAAAQGLTLQIGGPLIQTLATLSSEYARAYTEGEGLLRVFTSLGSAIARTAYGTDQGKLGELMIEEMELIRKIAEVRKTQWGDMRSGEIIQMETRLKSVRAEMEGLKAVLQPFEQGAAPAPVAAPKPAAVEPIIEMSKAVDAASKAGRNAVDDLQRESDSVRKFLQDYAKDRELMFQREVEQSRDRARALIEEFATPQEQAIEKLKEIERTLGADSETYKRAAVALFDELNPQIDKAQEKTEVLRSTFADLGATFSSAFEDAILGGERLSNVIEGLAKDIARLLLRKAVIDPLIEGIGSIFGGGGSSGGGVGGSIGTAIGSWLGGLFKNDRGGLYRVGGSGGGERPVAFTAQPGEYVAVGHGVQGGGGITVNVIGAQPRSVRERSMGGRRVIDLAFADTMANAASQGMLSTLGVNPALVAR